ncbi:MAG: hypothetical protein ABI051_03355 [Vicinamibacterales bacterium]
MAMTTEGVDLCASPTDFPKIELGLESDGAGGIERLVSLLRWDDASTLIGKMHSTEMPISPRLLEQFEFGTRSPTVVNLDTSSVGETVRQLTLERMIMRFGEPVSPWRKELERAIRSSAWIQSLSDDWDGEGSPAVTAATWQNAVATLRKLADTADLISMFLPVPSVAPNGQGSIDVFWSHGATVVLINVPAADISHAPTFSFVRAGKLTKSEYLDNDDSYVVAVQALNS